MDCEIRAYVKIYIVMFQYTIGEPKRESVPNTAIVYLIVVLSALFIILWKFKLEKVFLSNIWNLKTVC